MCQCVQTCHFTAIASRKISPRKHVVSHRVYETTSCLCLAGDFVSLKAWLQQDLLHNDFSFSLYVLESFFMTLILPFELIAALSGPG